MRARRSLAYNNYMDLLTKEELKSLFEARPGWCVSIFLPTHRAGRETLQDPIRLKNLLRKAHEGLRANGLRSAEVRELLAPAHNLLQRKFFWRYQDHGLALLISHGFFRYLRLPVQFPELVVVADRFHIKPLLPLFTSDGRFFILALSQKRVTLYEATRYHISEMDLAGVPRSLSEALKYDDIEQQIQFHTGTASAGGRRPAIFHGQGAGNDDVKERIFRYFREVDKGLQGVLKDRKAPLIVASVDYLFPIFKEASTHGGLLNDAVTGNPDTLSAEELHQAAWRIAEPSFDQTRHLAARQYKEQLDSAKTSKDVKEVLPAAYHGLVDFVFVALGVQQWGAFVPEENLISLHQDQQPGDEDLLNLVAIHSILHGGSVFGVQSSGMPDNSPVAAMFRH